MNRLGFFSNVMYMIGVGDKILGRTPIPKLKLPPSYPPPPPPGHTQLIAISARGYGDELGV